MITRSIFLPTTTLTGQIAIIYDTERNILSPVPGILYWSTKFKPCLVYLKRNLFLSQPGLYVSLYSYVKAFRSVFIRFAELTTIEHRNKYRIA